MELSSPLRDSWYVGPKNNPLYASKFNISWFRELNLLPSVILDVGSYDGGDAFRFKQAFPEAFVVAIEADPVRALVIEDNLKGENIPVIECAVTDHMGRVEWYQNTARGVIASSGSLFKMVEGPRKRFKQCDIPIHVGGCTLANICQMMCLHWVDLLHMDIEGAELKAIQGLGDLRPKLIYTELADLWLNDSPPKLIHEALLDLGYTHLASTDKNDSLYFFKG
jgi:FkbM family methyltransferase